MKRHPQRSTVILMALFALTLMTYVVIRPTVAAIHPPKPSSVNRATTKPRPPPTVRKATESVQRPRVTSTRDAPIGGRSNSPTGTPTPTPTKAPIPMVTANLPVQTVVPPDPGPTPPVDIPPPAPAPEVGPPVTEAP